ARLFKDLWADLRPGDILMGDRPFGVYVLLALLPLRGIDVVSRLHQGRRFNRRHAKRIAPSQWLVTWCRPQKRPDYLTEEEWATVPGTLTVRIIHARVQEKGFRTRELWISTTLLDPIAYPAERIAQLYRRRWDMELCFRDLKTTMGMEDLRYRWRRHWLSGSRGLCFVAKLASWVAAARRAIQAVLRIQSTRPCHRRTSFRSSSYTDLSYAWSLLGSCRRGGESHHSRCDSIQAGQGEVVQAVFSGVFGGHPGDSGGEMAVKLAWSRATLARILVDFRHVGRPRTRRGPGRGERSRLTRPFGVRRSADAIAAGDA
ncbi:MAG: transposase, partial [Verrucomicrobiota bacterium]|nr:transposase [Verrucomicrobiota bacterium]